MSSSSAVSTPLLTSTSPPCVLAELDAKGVFDAGGFVVVLTGDVIMFIIGTCLDTNEERREAVCACC